LSAASVAEAACAGRIDGDFEKDLARHATAERSNLKKVGLSTDHIECDSRLKTAKVIVADHRGARWAGAPGVGGDDGVERRERGAHRGRARLRGRPAHPGVILNLPVELADARLLEAGGVPGRVDEENANAQHWNGTCALILRHGRAAEECAGHR